MKTPKRYHKIPADRAHLDLEPDSWETDYHAQEARWKRRNKVKQLKHTIDKYKNGKNLFHDRGHLKSAYLRIQELGELEEGASIAECRGHLLLVDSIIKTLRWEQEKALRYIEIILDKHLP